MQSIYLDSVPGTSDIAEPKTQSMINVAHKPQQWMHPKRFMDESEEVQTCMIMKWILGSGPHAGISSGAEKIPNITTRLKTMKFNGYLRLLEVDTNNIMDHLTEGSRILFNDFKTKHKDDAWKCPHCNHVFLLNDVKWKCERCLFFYHGKCAKERKIKGKEEYSLCDSCFFAL